MILPLRVAPTQMPTTIWRMNPVNTAETGPLPRHQKVKNAMVRRYRRMYRQTQPAVPPAILGGRIAETIPVNDGEECDGTALPTDVPSDTTCQCRLRSGVVLRRQYH